MYKFVEISDPNLQSEMVECVVTILRQKFGFNINQDDFDNILESILEQIDELFDIDF